MNNQKSDRNLLGIPYKNSNLTHILNASGTLKAVAQRADGRKILVSLLMASFVVFINVSGILRLPELLVYDALVFHSYDKPQKNHALLLEVSYQQLNDSDELMNEVIDRLLSHSPKQIIIMHSLNQFEQSQQQKWLKHKNVSYAPRVYATLQDGGKIGYEYDSPTSLQSQPPLGFSLPTPSSFGITRAIPLEISSNKESLQSFQAAVTKKNPRNSNSIYINFNQGTAAIPRYQAQKLLEIGIVDELVKDKIILIVPQSDYSISGLTTPKNNHIEPLSHDLVQAMALNTLMNKSDISMLKPWQSAAACFLLFIVYLLIFQWLNIRFVSVITFISATTLLLIDWYLLSFHYFYIPIFSFFISIIAALLTAIPLHRIKEQSIIDTLRLDILSQLKSKKTLNSFYQVEDPWNQIIVFINQHLLLNRSILLERIENDHRVKEIISLGCSILDIAEMRRDYTRHPYDKSLQQQIPLDLENRHYFKKSFEGEKQFLVPLRFAEEILGFWAFTVIPDDHWDQNKFFSDINTFAKQIGLLIHNRKAFNYEDNINSKLLTQLLNFDLGSSNHKSLKLAVDGISHRLRIMESIFDGMSSAAILYDLFGQIISSNDLMSQLARESHLPIYECTSLDIISQACSITKDDARDRLRHVAMNSASIDLPLSDLIENRQYLLRIRSIKPQVQSVATINNDDAQPFQLLGILFEFINITPIQQRFTTDIVVYENLYAMLRNDLSSLSMCQLQLSFAPDTDQQLLTQMNQILQHCTAIVTNAEKLLDETSNNTTSTGKLIHPLDLLKRSLIELKDPIKQAKLSINTQLPSFSSLIFIDEDELDNLLRQSLRLLIDDAIPDTHIDISFKEQQSDELVNSGCIIITMRNTGYGMPQKELNAERKNTSYIEADSLSLFKKSVMSVSPWHVIVTNTSQVGMGFEINIELPVINFNPMIEI